MANKVQNFFKSCNMWTSNQHVMDWAVWQNAYWYQDFKQNRKIISKKANRKNKKAMNSISIKISKNH